MSDQSSPQEVDLRVVNSSNDDAQAQLTVEFTENDFMAPSSAEGYQDLLVRLTRQAEVVLRRQDPPIDESQIPMLAPQLVSMIEMQSQREEMPSALDRCKSGDTSLQLHEIVGHAFDFSIDEQGSQFLGEKLMHVADEEKDVVFEEIIHFALYLATHVSGNHVVQKFFHYGTEMQRSKLADMLLTDVDKLAIHMHGCHVIQTALEVPNMDVRVAIARELEPHVIWCAHSRYGCDVIFKIIDCVPEELIDFFISTLTADVVSLSTHPVAYRVIERVLEVVIEETTERIIMIRNILEAMHIICYDEFGHCIVERILEQGKPHERTAVIQRLSGHLMQMSRHPFASSVVEKSLLSGNPDEKWLLVNEILTITGTSDVLETMMKDKHANMVFQRVVQACRSDQFGVLMSRLAEYHSATANR